MGGFCLLITALGRSRALGSDEVCGCCAIISAGIIILKKGRSCVGGSYQWALSEVFIEDVAGWLGLVKQKISGFGLLPWFEQLISGLCYNVLEFSINISFAICLGLILFLGWLLMHWREQRIYGRLLGLLGSAKKIWNFLFLIHWIMLMREFLFIFGVGIHVFFKKKENLFQFSKTYLKILK